MQKLYKKHQNIMRAQQTNNSFVKFNTKLKPENTIEKRIRIFVQNFHDIRKRKQRFFFGKKL